MLSLAPSMEIIVIFGPFWTKADLILEYPYAIYVLEKYHELTESVTSLRNSGTLQIRMNHTEINFEYFQI